MFLCFLIYKNVYLFLFSGSRTGEVHIHDVRKPEHCISQLKCHALEVCGLRWSPDGRHLASGGNDNLVCLWKPSVSQDVTEILSGHKAAVKVAMIVNFNKVQNQII